MANAVSCTSAEKTGSGLGVYGNKYAVDQASYETYSWGLFCLLVCRNVEDERERRPNDKTKQ